jgi:spore germination protein (amino acid permease)
MQMENRIRVGSFEAITLIINLICTKLFLYYGRMTAEDAATAGWMSAIVSGLAAFIMFIVIIRLFKRFGELDIIDISEIAGGKVLKVIAGTVITTGLFFLTVIVVRKFTEDMKIVSLPSSPLSYVMSIFIIGIVVACFFGMEALLRFHAIVIPIIGAGYLLILAGVMPKFDITNLTPIFGTGVDDIVIKGFLRSSVYCELLVLFLLPPFLGGYKKVRKVGYISFLSSAAFLVIGSLAYTLVFPYPSSLEPFLPIYNITRMISLGRFFQRIESVFVFIWAMAALMYLTSIFYFMIYTFAKTAGLMHTRPLVLPFAVIVFSAAFMPDSLVEVINMESKYTNNIAWIVTFVFTGLILITASLRKRAGKGK